ncbi:MAG TPA: carbohydrate ABC transporter permease [Chloroflexota bacterium]|nr:carbohydrate ABC transporter permease [Chloroflexota bacterium]
MIAYLSRRNRGWLVLGYAIVTLFAAFAVIPLYWMLLTSFKLDQEILTPSARILPQSFTLDHYTKTFFETGYPRFLRNSTIVALATTMLSVLVGAMAGYAISRLRFRGRDAVARVLVYSYLVPASILFIPLFAMMVWLNLNNSLFGLALSYLTFTVPFCTWMLLGYFRTVPLELEEAALVDGATKWLVLWRIIVPLSAPAMVVVAVFSFTLSWNEFLYALVLVQDKEYLTAPVGLNSFMVGDQTFWGAMMAASTVMSIPPLLLYLIGQRWVIAGWTMGSVKG